MEEFDCLGLSLMAPNKHRKFIFDWDDVVRRKPENDAYSQFISSYMTISYKIIYNVSPPIILPQQRVVLQLRKDTRVGDNICSRVT